MRGSVVGSLNPQPYVCSINYWLFDSVAGPFGTVCIMEVMIRLESEVIGSLPTPKIFTFAHLFSPHRAPPIYDLRTSLSSIPYLSPNLFESLND